jgi:hypothetical protein
VYNTLSEKVIGLLAGVWGVLAVWLGVESVAQRALAHAPVLLAQAHPDPEGGADQTVYLIALGVTVIGGQLSTVLLGFYRGVRKADEESSAGRLKRCLADRDRQAQDYEARLARKDEHIRYLEGVSADLRAHNKEMSTRLGRATRGGRRRARKAADDPPGAANDAGS